MNPSPQAQMDLLAWAQGLEDERQQHESVNAERAARRGFIVIATDPSVNTDSPEYREVFATEAKTPNPSDRQGPSDRRRSPATGVPRHGHVQARTRRSALGGAAAPGAISGAWIAPRSRHLRSRRLAWPRRPRSSVGARRRDCQHAPTAGGRSA